MKTKLELEFLIDHSKKDFDILKKWTNTSKMTDLEAEENLVSLIAYKVAKLIEYDYQGLIDLLYKTDISEQKIKACFSPEKSTHEIAHDIGRLYLTRMQQKWLTRQEYSDENITGDW